MEAITLGETTIPCYLFEEKYKKLLDVDERTDSSQLEEQFKVIMMGITKMLFIVTVQCWSENRSFTEVVFFNNLLEFNPKLLTTIKSKNNRSKTFL